jgi:hypothetical protein
MVKKEYKLADHISTIAAEAMKSDDYFKIY